MHVYDDIRTCVDALRGGSSLDDLPPDVPITPSVPPSAPSTSASHAVATVTLQRLAIVIIAAHGILIGITHWLLLEQFLRRTPSGVTQPVAIAFWEYTLYMFGVEGVALAAAAAAACVVRLAIGLEGSGRRLAAAGLIAYAPVTLYSAAVLLALALGWQLEVTLMSAPGATAAEVAATIREALPIVLEPLLIGRHAATVVAAIAFGMLHVRLCRMSAWHSTAVAMAAGTAALATQLLMLGMPDMK